MGKHKAWVVSEISYEWLGWVPYVGRDGEQIQSDDLGEVLDAVWGKTSVAVTSDGKKPPNLPWCLTPEQSSRMMPWTLVGPTQGYLKILQASWGVFDRVESSGAFKTVTPLEDLVVPVLEHLRERRRLKLQEKHNNG